MHELPIISQEDALAPRHRQACGGAVRFLATRSTVEALRYEPELMSSTPPPSPCQTETQENLVSGSGERDAGGVSAREKGSNSPQVSQHDSST